MALSIEEIETNLKSVTDRVSLLDALINGVKAMFFRCSHSGLLFPADYISQWGRKYGLGLGPVPISETLDTDYNQSVVKRESVRSVDMVMHPFGVCRAQVDCVFLPAAGEHDMLILDQADPDYRVRSQIVRAKQLKNPASKIAQVVIV